uniref:Uncharacterized protein n=1 Tax=Romanomermis culicivorax TaxID=13658 RepID=A0A915HTG8_ROMCU
MFYPKKTQSAGLNTKLLMFPDNGILFNAHDFCSFKVTLICSKIVLFYQHHAIRCSLDDCSTSLDELWTDIVGANQFPNNPLHIPIPNNSGWPTGTRITRPKSPFAPGFGVSRTGSEGFSNIKTTLPECIIFTLRNVA